MKAIKKIIATILVFAMAFSVSYVAPVKTSAADTVAADSWKNNAIYAPEQGKLIGAGYIDVKWTNNLENASKYTVYVDGKAHKTVNATANEVMSVEFYTTKVSAHTTYIVAQLNDGSKVQTPVRTFYVTKKGICVDKNMGQAVDPAALNLGWYYNWGTKSFKDDTAVKNTKFDNLEFVPMIWGKANDTYSNIFSKAQASGYKYMLGYNEPDQGGNVGGSQISTSYASSYWTKSIVPNKGNMRLGSPSPAHFPVWSEWWAEYWNFLSPVGKANTDFIPFHYYQKNYEGPVTAQQYLQAVDETYYKYKKPIWITEFAMWRWTRNDTVNAKKSQEFMKIVLKGLDERSYVERYSWFSPDSEGEAGSSALFVFKTGQLTETGKIYAQLGIPAGYKAKTYGVSTYVSTNTSPIACVGAVKTTLYSLGKKKKSFKYTIKSVTNAAGYQIQYSLSKKFSKKKKYKTKSKYLNPSSDTVKTGTIKGLKRKKKYYVRVRAYKNYTGTKLYCKWSKTMSVKTK